MISFAYHTITWRLDIGKALAEIEKAGFSGFETFSFPPSESDTWPGYVARLTEAYRHNKETYLETTAYRTSDDLKRMMARHNLSMSSMYCSGLFIDPDMQTHEIAAIGRAMQFVRETGAKHLVIGGGMNLSGSYSRDDYHRFYDSLHTIGQMCNDSGLTACYHPHSGTMVENGEQLDLFCRETDPSLISLAPDTGHMIRGEINPVEAIHKYAERIKYIHLKDIRDNEFYELGRGGIDFTNIIRALLDIEYTGWAVVELDDTTSTPLESAVMSRKYIADHLENLL